MKRTIAKSIFFLIWDFHEPSSWWSSWKTKNHYHLQTFGISISRGIKLSKIKVLSFIKSVWLAFDLLTFLLSLPVEPTAFRCSAHFDLWELPCDWPQRQMPSGPFCTWSYRKKCHFSSTSDLIRDRLTKSLNQNWQWAFFQFSCTRTRTHTHAHTLSHAYVTKSIPGK